ncbi:hypothetical protein DIPPA_06826 [Diplonema papillatum]|nr:hypothetical protein DIPPA_06826 [Diplonema papillatum]
MVGNVQEMLRELGPQEALWPFLEEKAPTTVETTEEFVQEVLFGSHRDKVVVLPNGIEKLNQQNAIPAGLQEALLKSSRVWEVLANLAPDAADTLKGRLWQYNEKGKESEIKRADKLGSLKEVWETLRTGQDDGTYDKGVPLYISELRNNKKVRHPVTGEMVKTATQIDVMDVIPQAGLAPFWERGEGGIFLGERGSGSGLHVDQCLWSNVGKQWQGYKLFAVWPWEERIAILEDAKRGSIFHFPLGEEEVKFLERACVVALIKPGDVFVFSGGIPHMAMCVGDQLNVTAYESMIPLNEKAIYMLARTNSKDHFKKCWMDDDDLDELLEDVVDALAGNVSDRNIDDDTRREIQACEEAMKQHGDAYCRRLWEREDARRKRVKAAPVVDRNACTVNPASKRMRLG